jgi:hypothetical protein
VSEHGHGLWQRGTPLRSQDVGRHKEASRKEAQLSHGVSMAVVELERAWPPAKGSAPVIMGCRQTQGSQRK